MKTALIIHEGRVPKLRGSLGLGVLPGLFRDPLSVYREAAALGDLVRLPLPVGRAYFLSSPALIQEVMQKKSAIFQRPPALRRALQSLGGDNLMTREGSAWLSRRRLMTPSLQRSEVRRLAGEIVAAIDTALDTWVAHAGETVCLRDLLVLLVREVLARTLLGVSIQTFPEIGDAFSVLTRYICYRATTPLAAPLWLPTRRHRGVRRAQRDLDGVADRILAEHRSTAVARPNLLTSLLQADDPETGAKLDDVQLRRELQVLVGAGETTTAEALAFCFSLLGRHPDVLARVLRELDGALGSRRIELSDLPQLPLLRQVLDETLRLYPPSYVLARSATEATTLGDLPIRAGTTVVYSPYTLHREPRFWSAPEEFRPERFAPGGEASAVPRYAYLPFGAGPRRCMGESLAQLEMIFAVARILQRFTLRLPRDPLPALSAGFALGLADGLPAGITPRDCPSA
ncbi:MAG: cytochrome [Myxococcaceae bacterium]|nr:cytochrome [Myxococcaceae bacterium]